MSPRVVPRLLGLAIPLLGGCPEPPPAGPCAGDGDPVLALANRGAAADLADGDELEVFPPPQGGVFTELDVTIDSMAASELQDFYVRVDAAATGESLATVRYYGETLGMILRCTEEDLLVVDNVPVGFADALSLTDLDGVAAVLTGTLETTRGDFETRYEVVLHATEY